MLPASATEFYATQQRVSQVAATEIRRAWRRMGDDFDASWRRVAPIALAILAEAQSVMALTAADYVPRVLAETDTPDLPVAEFRPESLVGRASDGRRLDTLAYGAVTESKATIKGGATTAQGLAAGESWLDLMVKLQVADAARQAVGVMTTARPNLGGTVRVLNPPSCQRCAILAGRVYRWSRGFERHPRCDCVNLPVRQEQWAKAEGFVTSPMDAYRNGEIRDLTAAQVQAIEDGADITKVVNAYRGMSTTATRTRGSLPKASTPVPPLAPGQPDLLDFIDPSVRFRTTEVPQGLLTPEGIYLEAAGNREKAISLLREFGYIT